MFFRTVKSIFIGIYDYIGLIMLSNILFVLASLPIVTIPAAIFCLSEFLGALSRGEEKPDFRHYLLNWKQIFFRGGLMILITLLVSGVLLMDCHALLLMSKDHPSLAFLLLGFVMCICIIWLLMQIYAIPTYISQNMAILRTLKMVLVIVLDNFTASLLFGGFISLFLLLMILTGIGPLVMMFSGLLYMQHVIMNNIMEQYHE